MDALIRKMLEEERDKAAAQEHAEIAKRSSEQAEAYQRQQEAQVRRYEAEKRQLEQQAHQARTSTMQNNRTSDWYTAPIGTDESIRPVDPRAAGYKWQHK